MQERFVKLLIKMYGALVKEKILWSSAHPSPLYSYLQSVVCCYAPVELGRILRFFLPVSNYYVSANKGRERCSLCLISNCSDGMAGDVPLLFYFVCCFMFDVCWQLWRSW